MSETARGEFEITDWQQEPWDETDGFVLGRAKVTKLFHGDAEGSTSIAHLVLATKGETGVAYGGLERFAGNLNGRKGGFALQHDAGPETEGGMRWSILPGSGSGELAGIHGLGSITHDAGKHSYEITYDLD